jgi:hypothetical protein
MKGSRPQEYQISSASAYCTDRGVSAAFADRDPCSGALWPTSKGARTQPRAQVCYHRQVYDARREPDPLDDELDEEPIVLGRERAAEGEDDWDDGPDLGPDERDRDLMDGTWEQRYYAGRTRTRDWRAVTIGLSLLVLMAIVVPSILVVTQ